MNISHKPPDDPLRRPDATRDSFVVSRWLFLRCLGVVFFLAIVDYWRQFPGLIGEHGLQPAMQYLAAATDAQGSLRFLLTPTLCWFNASDGFIHCLCMMGVAASALLIAGFAPLVVLPILWIIYLSLITAGGVFYGFAWDVLLLETALLAIAIAPAQWYERPTRARRVSNLARGLFYLLLFKVLFLPGLMKLISLDPAWRNLVALKDLYFTQPLPTWSSWYLHHMPSWFHRATSAVIWMVELGAPLLIFCGRRGRHVAAWAVIGLQLLIAVSGNFGYLTGLTIVLCILLLDDAMITHMVPGTWRQFVPRGLSQMGEATGRRIAVRVFAVVVVTLSLIVTVQEIAPSQSLSRSLRYVRPLRSVNGYSHGRTITTQRPEIIIEGSHDQRNWQAYAFKNKPGDITRAPGFVAPFHPRLDWQMWFAARGSAQRNPWFDSLLFRLSQNEPAVMALLERNPFADHPPRYLRATVWDYQFTTPAAHRDTGAWWKRKKIGDYTAVIDVQKATQP